MFYFTVDASRMNDRQPAAIGNADTLEILGEGTPFRMMDDDGNLYFTGMFYGDASSEDAFAPLDMYGENYGCTTIEYLEHGRWTVL